MQGHAPGPWKRGGELRYIIDSQGDRVAEVSRLSELPFDDARFTNNARLIAASPDLLAALEAIRTEAGDALDGEDMLSALDTILGNARAAIRKATGE